MPGALAFYAGKLRLQVMGGTINNLAAPALSLETVAASRPLHDHKLSADRQSSPDLGRTYARFKPRRSS